MATVKAMLMVDIRRESLGESPDTTSALVMLAESAKSVLGYDVLAKQVGTSTEVANESELRKALRELDIDVLNPVDVRRYQKERLVEETTIRVRKWLEEVGQQGNRDNLNAFSGPGWGFQKIAEYHQPVPEFVLAKAVQIKQQVPECEIYVESLSDHPDPFLFVGTKSKYSWMKPDEMYYVEVWEEPKFEGRLRARQDAAGAAGAAGAEEDIPF